MARLREALTILLDKSQHIQQRLDRLVPKASPRFLPNFGKAIITAILHVAYPDEYGVYNGTSEAGMKAIGVFPSFEPSASFATRYLEVNKILHELASGVQADLWTLDALWWLMRSKHAKPAKPKARSSGRISATRLALLKDVDVCANVKRFMEGNGNDKGRRPDERATLRSTTATTTFDLSTNRSGQTTSVAARTSTRAASSLGSISQAGECCEAIRSS